MPSYEWNRIWSFILLLKNINIEISIPEIEYLYRRF